MAVDGKRTGYGTKHIIIIKNNKTYKVCHSCQEEKELIEFSKSPKLSSGVRSNCKSCDRKTRRKFYNKYRENKIRWAVEYNRYKHTGFSKDLYTSLLKKQKGVCAICGGPPVHKKSLSADHDHITKKTRGLLCGPCNTGLGGFKDNIELLQTAIEYLKRYN